MFGSHTMSMDGAAINTGCALKNLLKENMRMKTYNGDGAKIWIVPDGYLPDRGLGPLEGHEALMITNTSSKKADAKIDVYFEDKEAVKDISVEVGAERVLCIRLDKPFGKINYKIPGPDVQYSLRVRSNVKIVVQFGRLDVRQPNLAYYGTMAYPVK